MLYQYPELLSQMLAAELSPWDNLWNEVFEVTPQNLPVNSAKTKQAWMVAPALQWNFVPPLGWAQEAFEKVSAYRGHGKISGLHQITRDDLSNVEITHSDEDVSRALSL